MKLSQLKEEIRTIIREVKLEEGFTNPKVSNPTELAKTVLGWFDFYTDYIDDGGQRRRAIQKNDNTLEWFSSHPVDVKEKAYKIMVAQAKGDKSKIEGTFGKYLKEVVTEDKSLKRFLDPFTWLKYSDQFQRRFRNISPSVVQELIKMTKENGHGVLIIDKNAFATLDKNPKETDEVVWKYYNGVLYYTNPKNKSIYDTLIPKLVNSKNEVVTEEKKYDIGSGWMGNGLTIWNRAEEKNGEYKIIAHISKDGTLKIYDKALPNDIKKMFQMWADTMKKGDRPGIY
jgi:hypothetical protein